MTPAINPNPAAAGSGIAANPPNPKDAADAARQFEALLIHEMLKSARSGDSGALCGSEDESGAALSDMAEQQFAQLLASNGGMGLAKLVMEGLADRTASKAQSSHADRQHGSERPSAGR